MGRRAKNKQGEPAPLKEFDETSSRRSEKRKAEDDGLKRLPKKSKPSAGVKHTSKKGVTFTKDTKGKSKAKNVDEEESLGWEDIEDDDEDLKAHAACVLCSIQTDDVLQG